MVVGRSLRKRVLVTARDWVMLVIMIATLSVVFVFTVRLFAYPQKRYESLGLILLGAGAAAMNWPFFAYGTVNILYALAGFVLLIAGVVFLVRSKQSAEGQ